MNSIAELLEDIRAGKMVILIDDEDRENEGDLILAADHISAEKINFMATYARGLICLSLTTEQIQRLKLPLMVKDERNASANKTAFTVSIEAAEGVTTGISAADRAHTIRVAANPSAQAIDVVTPGHVFPIRAQEGGVLRRAGHTEASVDLARLAGLNPSAVICEIMNSDGTMARLPDLIEFARANDIKIGTIESLIEYRIQNEMFVEEIARSPLPSSHGEGFEVRVFRNRLDGREHLALIKGELNPETPALVRVHTENLLGDVFGSLRSQSGDYLRAAMDLINREGLGALVYLRMEEMEGRLLHRVREYAKMAEEEKGLNVQPKKFRSDYKDYGVGAQILRALGLKKIRLMTNNPSKRVGLPGYGLEIVGTVELPICQSQRDSLGQNNNEFVGEVLNEAHPG